MSNEEFMKFVVDELKKNIEFRDTVIDKFKEIDAQFSEVRQEIAEVKQEVAEVKQEVAEVKQEVAEIKQEVAEVKQEVERVKHTLEETRETVILMENEHGRKLGALGDGYNKVYEKLEPLPEAVEQLQEDVSVIKLVITKNSKDINLLKTAT